MFTITQWGLVNAATMFQRFIEEVLHGLDNVFVYIDYILIYSDTIDSVITIIGDWLSRLLKAGLLVNTQKSFFCLMSTPCRGNVLELNVIFFDSTRISAIMAWSFLATTLELKSFLGAAGFVSVFVPDYGLIKGVLRPLLSQKIANIPTKR